MAFLRRYRSYLIAAAIFAAFALLKIIYTQQLADAMKSVINVEIKMVDTLIVSGPFAPGAGWNALVNPLAPNSLMTILCGMLLGFAVLLLIVMSFLSGIFYLAQALEHTQTFILDVLLTVVFATVTPWLVAIELVGLFSQDIASPADFASVVRSVTTWLVPASWLFETVLVSVIIQDIRTMVRADQTARV